MRKIRVEFIVGIFMMLGFAAFVYLSLQLGEFSFFASHRYYPLVAEFTSVSGLKEGSQIEIAGVLVGRVAKLSLGKNNQARVTMLLDKDIKITEDAIDSIRTQGIIGDKYIKILQGGSETSLKPGDVILDTESAVDVEELISKYIFNHQ